METQVRPLVWGDPLEKGMATHSSILAWKIPRSEEPGRLYSPWGGKEPDPSEWLIHMQATLSRICGCDGMWRVLWRDVMEWTKWIAREEYSMQKDQQALRHWEKCGWHCVRNSKGAVWLEWSEWRKRALQGCDVIHRGKKEMNSVTGCQQCVRNWALHINISTM